MDWEFELGLPFSFSLPSLLDEIISVSPFLKGVFFFFSMQVKVGYIAFPFLSRFPPLHFPFLRRYCPPFSPPPRYEKDGSSLFLPPQGSGSTSPPPPFPRLSFFSGMADNHPFPPVPPPPFFSFQKVGVLGFGRYWPFNSGVPFFFSPRGEVDPFFSLQRSLPDPPQFFFPSERQRCLDSPPPPPGELSTS